MTSIFGGNTVKEVCTRKDFVLDISNIDSLFEIDHKRRRIQETQVNAMARNLENGKHFESELTLNFRNGKYRICDGNHRHKSIHKFLTKNPTSKVKVCCKIYINLTDEEENEIYTDLQKARRESSDDFLHKHQEEIVLYKKMVRKFPFPITIYGGTTSFKFRNLVDAYLGVKLLDEPMQWTGGNEVRLIEYQALELVDYKYMERFVEEFNEHLGAPITGSSAKANKWAKTTPFGSLMRLHYDNSHAMGSAKFWKDVKKKILPNSTVLGAMINGGRTAQVITAREMAVALNISQPKTRQYTIEKRGSL